MYRSESSVDIEMYCFCFIKQKTAYEMLRSLVGSEMCIRDSCERWGVRSRVLPMCDGQFRTQVRITDGSLLDFQEYLSLIHI